MLYNLVFTEDIGFGPALYKEKLYDFLYEENFDGSFLDLYNRHVNNERDLKDLILNLHTGMAYVSRTQTLADKQAIGQNLIKSLALSMLKLLDPDEINFGIPIPKDEDMLGQGLKNALELDGYIYKNQKLLPIESSVIDEPAEQDYLADLVDRSALADRETIKHHLKRSEEHFVDGRWDDSISNSRKVLDAILRQVMEAIYLKVNRTAPPPAMLKNATDIRLFLEAQGIVTKIEREALDKNYGLLSATGGHPYIAEKDQARLNRHLALTYSQFVLLRYQGYLKNNP